MKKIVIVNGSIAGLIVGAMLFITAGMYYRNNNFDNGMMIGYATMIVAFSMIFTGIKSYRDKYNDGLISFGKAFKIGLYITLIASTIYVVVWLIDYYCFLPDFGEKYATAMLQKLKAGGASQAKIAALTKEMAWFTEMYKKPIFVVLFTYIEILPVGLIITLISSFILKRKVKPAISISG